MGRFVFGTEKIDGYINEVDQILEAVGHPTALVTDISQFFDFTIDPSYGDSEEERTALQAENDKVMERVRKLCGAHIYEHDTLVFAAEQLRNRLNVG